jgi:hypothetical protein
MRIAKVIIINTCTFDVLKIKNLKWLSFYKTTYTSIMKMLVKDKMIIGH